MPEELQKNSEIENNIENSQDVTEEFTNTSEENLAETTLETEPSNESVETSSQNIQEQAITQPQIIVQKERGFSHYVGFALLSVLCIFFFFMPGIAITYGVSCLVDLSSAATWIFSAILSLISWLIFKLKIRGFKKSFYAYIGLCVAVMLILTAIQAITDINIFANILALLTGAKA